MIAVVAHPRDYELVREFFELFKIPWEFYRPERQYEVVLIAREDASVQDLYAKFAVVYASRKTPFDEEGKIEITSHRKSGAISYKGRRLPIYGKRVTLRGNGSNLLNEEDSQLSAGTLVKAGHKIVARVGYDLFEEIRILLTEG